jgi:hypothetical protein
VPELCTTGGVQSVFGRMAALKKWSDEAARILNEILDLLYSHHLQQEQAQRATPRTGLAELHVSLADLKVGVVHVSESLEYR